METAIYEIELKDGRIFRIFYANSTQKKRLFNSLYKIRDLIKSRKVITNGIHTVSQFEKMIPTI